MSYSIYPTSYGNVTVSAATATATTGYTYTSAGTSATDLVWGSNGNWNNVANPVTISQKATIELKGEDADIVINGESLNETLKEIKNALRVPGNLKRNPELEKDWEELQKAADHYDKLKREFSEKQRVWNALKDTDV